MSQPHGSRFAGGLLWAIVAVYLVLATLFAVYTPAWQAPDEPAHYNYVRYLADQYRFPVLKAGDFPAGYLDEIKGAHFPAEMSIAPLRYEFHQPPLYYQLAAPLYRLFGGALLPLRLFSVVLGALLLPVTWATVREVVPGVPGLALGATALVAFLPMHLAMSAAVNNDGLAELLASVILLLAVRSLKEGGDEGGRLPLLLGIGTGLALVTKSSLYILLPVVLLAIAARRLWVRPAGHLGRDVGFFLVPAVALALPWWLRNVALYGGLDFLALGRHEQVVVGQLRTAEFVAAHGLPALERELLLTSFRSFWGQFGWMGVLLDERLYQALAVLSAVAMLGLAAWAAGAWRRRGAYPRWQWAAVGLLLLWAALTAASYAWYNVTFVQHQGRYLFRALAVIGLLLALGWREALGRRWAWPLTGLLLAAALVGGLLGWLSPWPLAMVVGTAAVLAGRGFLPERLDPLLHAGPYLLLVPLDLASLFLFIVPQLAA